eukprot:PhM_4_TR19048/c0_g1_i1/m.31898/K11662/ACTR6, ARP6; actin-related protein 6
MPTTTTTKSSFFSVLVIDNGSDTIKAAMAKYNSNNKHNNNSVLEIPNLVVKPNGSRALVGRNVVQNLQNAAGDVAVHRPTSDSSGYLADVALQRVIWSELETVFRLSTTKDDEKGSLVVMTVPPFLPDPQLREPYENLIMTSLGDKDCRVKFATFPSLVAMARTDSVSLVVDIGHQATWVVAYIDHPPRAIAAKRLDVGGKTLTNVLKEAISFRQVDVQREPLLVAYIKRISRMYVVESGVKGVEEEIKSCQRNRVQYATRIALPNGTTVPGYGYALPPSVDHDHDVKGAQMVYLSHERFCVPEVLFSPTNAGIPLVGLSHVVAHVIDEAVRRLRGDGAVREALLSNIVVTGGGGCNLPGVARRLEHDLTTTLGARPEGVPIHITVVSPTEVVRRAAEVFSAQCQSNHDQAGGDIGVSVGEYLKNKRDAAKRLWHGV